MRGNGKTNNSVFLTIRARQLPIVRPISRREAYITLMACPLCKTDEVREFWRDDRRDYFRCHVCGMVFVPPRQFLSPEAEKKRYDLHQNSLLDPGYRRFLSRLFIPLERCLAPGSFGLDFGSGPEPALSRMFEEAGHSMTCYDRYYELVPAALEKQYDFITATEVVEHLHDPQRELERLWACLKPGGKLGIMTQSAAERDDFPTWHYKNDLTHVCFFSQETFTWIGARWNADLMFPECDVVLFHKKLLSSSSPAFAVRGIPR